MDKRVFIFQKKSQNNNPIKVLDASSFIHGYNPSLEEGEHYTTSSIVEEVKSKRDIIYLALEYGKLYVREPKRETVEMVKRISIETGDNLSHSDIEILALTVDLGGVLYTDDYGLQNVARKLSVPFKPVVSKGIRKEFVWRLVCKGCKRIYSIDYMEDVCEICGSPLERKMIKKERMKKKLL